MSGVFLGQGEQQLKRLIGVSLMDDGIGPVESG
jgi:hypothetical protein